jgi:DNA-binding transcriptional LysR family regulator
MNLHRLNLASLSLFSLSARCGSISKGAELARMAVGAASKRITDLEAAVGTPLFERHSRGVSLTPAGLALQRHASRILGNVEEMAAELSDYARGVLGAVRLWANTSAVTQFLPRDLSVFAVDHPAVGIEMREQDSREIVMAVLDGRADVGIFADRTPPLGLPTRVYRRDRLVLVAPSDHALAGGSPIRFAEAKRYDFVSLSQGTSLAERVALHAEGETSLRVRIQVRSFDAICQMVSAGFGLAVLPQEAARPLARSLGLSIIGIEEAWARRELLLAVRDFEALPRVSRALVDHLLLDAPEA